VEDIFCEETTVCFAPPLYYCFIFTAVSLLLLQASEEVVEDIFCEETSVTFAPLSSALIQAYVNTGEPNLTPIQTSLV
jgi:hypothetical protein